MSATLSGSGMARARACPASCALPAVHTESKYASNGSAVHEFLAKLASGEPRDEALATVPDEVGAVCAGIEPEKVPHGETEVSFAYDTATGQARRLGARDRAYNNLLPTEIPGTADLVRPPSDVADWKTVQWDFDPNSARPQLEFYALCAARSSGVDHASCSIGVVTTEGKIAWHQWSLDLFDLARVAGETRRTWRRVEEQRADRIRVESTGRQWVPDVTEGAHCQYCAAALACPAKRAAVGAILGQDLAQLTPETIGAAYLKSRDVAKLLEQLRDAAKTFVSERGSLPTGDGRVIRRDGRGALRVVPGGA